MADKPNDYQMPDADYAGDLTAAEVWNMLGTDAGAVLVDVRTQVEWQLIGKADLSELNKEPFYLQWVTMNGLNENFEAELLDGLKERGVEKTQPVIFMCQSGGRSKMAAMQLAAHGYTQSFNFAEGFEGELDEHRHRNSINGWKASGLPWYQS